MEDLFVSLRQNLGHQGVNFEYYILESLANKRFDVKLLTYLYIYLFIIIIIASFLKHMTVYCRCITTILS